MAEKMNQLDLKLRCLALAACGRSRQDMVYETDIPMERINKALHGAMRKLQADNLAEAIFRAAGLELIS
ncbi:transcriptional regulator [Sinorhizobium psoraleae]|uniref:Transcriptional regulator n=1 Tax=Sinorhizobium psoraleae TaxID=520838 RepID=A0ABT4KHV4_9HYPH|nr:transcriptional regulator [Sinorhizobium psoraleae]MCZ4091549.1 transcriptional regulator [Sinorhizobium psoraleae]